MAKEVFVKRVEKGMPICACKLLDIYRITYKLPVVCLLYDNYCSDIYLVMMSAFILFFLGFWSDFYWCLWKSLL